MVTVIFWRRLDRHLELLSTYTFFESYLPLYRIILDKYHITLSEFETFELPIETFKWLWQTIATGSDYIKSMTCLLPFDMLWIEMFFFDFIAWTYPDLNTTCFIFDLNWPGMFFSIDIWKPSIYECKLIIIR